MILPLKYALKLFITRDLFIYAIFYENFMQIHFKTNYTNINALKHQKHLYGFLQNIRFNMIQKEYLSSEHKHNRS